MTQARLQSRNSKTFLMYESPGKALQTAALGLCCMAKTGAACSSLQVSMVGAKPADLQAAHVSTFAYPKNTAVLHRMGCMSTNHPLCNPVSPSH